MATDSTINSGTTGEDAQDILSTASKFAQYGPVLGQLITTAGQVGVGIYSSKQQAKLQGELALLNADEQKKLQAQLLKAQDQQSKLALIENAIKNKQRQENLPLYIGLGLLVVGVGVGLYFVLRKK